MAVILCKELFPGRRGSDGIERKLKHTRVFEVLTDDPLDDDYIAGAGDGVTIPRNGDIHPNNPYAVMVSITADQDDETPYRWVVVCEYDTELPRAQAREAGGYDASGASQVGGQGSSPGTTGNPLARDDDPLARPAMWRVSHETTQEVVTRCKSGFKPDDNDPTIVWNWGLVICNTAGYPFDPPPMVEASQTVITITKNYPIGHTLLSLSSQTDYIHHINAAEWKGLAAYTVRITGMDIEYSVENGIEFGRITFQLKHRWEGWNLELLDCGYYETDFGGGETFELDVPEGSGKPPNEPQLLDGAGFRKAPGDPPVFLEFGIYEIADFDDLGL